MYIQSIEMHKDILFVTNVLQTATSFIHNFETEMIELQKEYIKEYYNKRPLNKAWFYESGWNSKIQSLTDRLNMHITNQKSFDEVETIVLYCGNFNYEKVRVLWVYLKLAKIIVDEIEKLIYKKLNEIELTTKV